MSKLRRHDNAAATEDTIAAGATADTVAAAATQDTLAATPFPPADSRNASRPGSAVTTQPRSGVSSTVGDELHGATIERFGEVERDRFQILDELARGGLGRIFRARDPRTGRIVAIKEVLRKSEDIEVRFAREALVTANLQHPSIVPVYEVGRWPGGEPFYAMKLVRGRTLEDRIADARGAAARLELVPHVIDVAEALAYAHSERVIHRDLKPGNVLVGAYGETVVIDWGLARSLAADDARPDAPAVAGDAAPGQTVAGAVVGTPSYMPPEQAAGNAIDERADVYAIGAILYHVLSGRRPYAHARAVADVLAAVTAGPPTPLGELAPDVPAELIAIVEQAMAHAPADRYPTAEGLAEDLRRWVSGQLVAAHRYTTWQLIRRWIGRHRAVVATAAVALVTLAVVAVIGIRRITAERDEAERQRRLAQDAQASAERAYADSLVELARQALVEHDLGRALPHLTLARERLGSDHPLLAFLVGRARALFAGLVAVAPEHELATTSAAITPDGTRLVTAGAEGVVRAWDLTAHQPAWQVRGEGLIAMSPDGAWLAGADPNGEAIVVRAVRDGREHRRWPLTDRSPDEKVVGVTWAPAGGRFAIATSAGRVAILAVDDSAVALAKPHGDATISCLTWSPSGQRLASGDDRGTTLVLTPGAAPTTLADGTTAINACAWLDDARLVTGDEVGVARQWEVSARRIERRFEQRGNAIMGFALDPARRWLATYGAGTVVTLWDLATGGVVHRLDGHRLGIWHAMPIGPYLVSVDETNQVLTWDPATGERLGELPGTTTGKDIAVGGDRLAVFGRGRTYVWRVVPETVLQRVRGHTARVRDVVYSADGRWVWSASSDGTARGVDTTGAEPTRVLGTSNHTAPPIRTLEDGAAVAPSPHGLRSVTVSADGSSVATVNNDGTIVVWDATSGRETSRFTGHVERARRVVFARDGRTAYSVGDATVRRWEVATGRELARAALAAPGWDVALVGDDTVATLDDTKVLALWDAATLASRRVELASDALRDLIVDGDRLIAATRDTVNVVTAAGTIAHVSTHDRAFAAHVAGDWIAVGDVFGQAAIYARTTLALHRLWRVDPAGVVVTQVRLRPDGRVLATATGERVRLWTPDGLLLGQTPELGAMITQLAWSPDGRQLAIAGGSGTVWLWNLAPDDGRDLDAFARCVSPWMPVAPGAQPRPFDPASCRALVR